MIKIDNSGVDDALAIWLVGEVVKAGRLSDGGAAYCAISTFTSKDGVFSVRAERTKAGVDSFKVWQI